MRGYSCQNVEDLLDEYLQGTLTKQSKIQFEMHLGICEKCRETLETWQGFLHVSRTEEPNPISPMIRRRLTIAGTMELPPESRAVPINWKRLAIASVGFAAAALVALVLVLHSSDFRRDVHHSAGEMGNAEAHGAAESLSETNGTLGAIQIASDGRRVIRVTPGTNLWLGDGAETEVLMINDGMAKFRLSSGRVVAEVQAPVQGYRFIVVTPKGEVEAKGTIFAVEVKPDGRETAQVVRGVVEVRSNIEMNHLPVSPVTLYEGQLVELGIARQTQADRGSLKRDACLVVGCNDPKNFDLTGLQHHSDFSPQTNARANAQATVDSFSCPHTMTEKETASADSHSSSRRMDNQGKKDLTQHNQKKIESAADNLVSLALQQRKERRYGAAADTYRDIIHNYPSSAAAANALVSLGQLELVELGRPRKALQHYANYIERAPKGFLVEEARLGLVRAYYRLKQFKKAVQAATLYLESHPDGYAGAEVLRLRGDAKQALGDCTGAIRDYRNLRASWPGSRQNDRISLETLTCPSAKSTP